MTLASVTILGCGGSAGVPMIGGADGRGDWGACDPAEPRNRRTRASVLLQAEAGARLLVDTSPDLRMQLLACAVPSVEAILFTHAHADHVLGIDDVRILNRIAKRPLGAYATQRTLHELHARFDYAFRPWQPPGFFRPVLLPMPLDAGAATEISGLMIQTFNQSHGYIETLGVRCGWFAYSTDVVALDDAAFEALAGVDTWVVDCFQRQPHSSHVHLAKVLEWAARVGARRTILTHMGNDMDWANTVARVPHGVEPAFDGMLLTEPRQAGVMK